jgi:hypothetical protein
LKFVTMLGRGVVVLALLCVLVGFGACGAWGAFGGVVLMFTPGDSRMFGLMMLVPGLIGLWIAWNGFKEIRALVRESRARKDSSAD